MILAWYLDHYLYTATSKKLTMKSRWQFMANLEQPRSLILWPTMSTFSLIKIFYLAKAEDRTQQPLAQSSSYCFEKFLPKKACFFVKKKENADPSKPEGVLYFLKLHMCHVSVLTYQIWSFSHFSQGKSTPK